MNVNDIVNTIGSERPVDAGDYMKDGILYCHKCNTPKQCRTEILGNMRIVPCMCECEAAEMKRKEAEEDKRKALERIGKLKAIGFPDDEMAGWTFDIDADPESKVSQVARNYVKNFDMFYKAGKGLLFYGAVGTGKTFLSACIVNALIEQGRPCLCTNFARITNTIQSRFEGRQEYLDGMNRFDLLVIDDLAAERDTEFMGEIIMNIIDTRYRTGKPIIVTTNLTANELRNPTNIRRARIFSRLFEMTMMVEVNGPDRRKQKAIDDYSKFANILGI